MNINFVDRNFIDELIHTDKIIFDIEPDLDYLKGMTLGYLGAVFINVSAMQWKDYDENKLIEEMTKTITHECNHVLIKQLCRKKYSSEGEETVCRIMANQE